MKEVVTKDNYKRKVLGRMITVCWALLLICFVVKIFGGNFFAFIGESKVVDYIINNVWLFIPYKFIFYFVATYLTFMIIFNHKYKALSAIMTIIMFSFKQFVNYNAIMRVLAFVIEFLCLIVIPIILKRKWYDLLYINIIVIIFQIVSLFVKNLSVFNFNTNEFVAYVYMLDYYIMVIMAYLYSKKGEISLMEIGIWFLSTDKTQLEAYKDILAKRKAKKQELLDIKNNKKKERITKKYDKTIAAVNNRIEKINKK